MSENLKIGIAGLGTVGSALVDMLQSEAEMLAFKSGRSIQITGVNARDKFKERGFSLKDITWHETATALAIYDDIDVFVELIGGDSGPAEEAVRAALQAGKHVVSANKALIAKHGVEFARIAERRGVQFNYEAAVGGGIPIIKAMREGLIANNMSKVSGILNGTCNYILTRMEELDLSFDECLAEAQRLGYAEADPTFDIEGFDTAHKLSILSSLAFGAKIDSEAIYVEGISAISLADIHAAQDLGYKIKLLGVAEKKDNGIEQRVHPAMIKQGSSLANISGVTNAVEIIGDAIGTLLLAGEGAGPTATASAVVSDICDIARGAGSNMLGRPIANMNDQDMKRMRSHQGSYFVRINVSDQVGALASIGQHMASAGVSMESVIQKASQAGQSQNTDTKQIVFLTHRTNEAAVREALVNIHTDGHIVGAPQLIRLEDS